MAQWSAAALLLLFYVSLGVGVEVSVGSRSVPLPCTSRPLTDSSSVLWTWGTEQVHLRVNKEDDTRDQSRLFKGRTMMKSDAEKTGDLSLELINPTLTDQGTYTCVVKEGDTEVNHTTVELKVKGVEERAIAGRPVSLPFQMRALGSEARVQWTWEPEEPEGSQGLQRSRRSQRSQRSQGSQEVHLLVGGRDNLTNQNSHFRGRTEMKPNALETGDLSLELNNASDTDTGTYKCVVKENNNELGCTTVKLNIIYNKGLPETENIIGIIIGVIIIIILFIILLFVLIVPPWIRMKKTKESFKDAFVGVITCRPPTVL